MEKDHSHGNREIERKFLLKEKPEDLAGYPAEEIIQGYLAVDPVGTEIRLRQRGDCLCLTLKQGHGLNRLEQNVELSQAQWDSLWPFTLGRRIQKTRHLVPWRELTIEVDVYGAAHQRLIVAEVEFPDETSAAAFHPPEWLGAEVTGNRRYQNNAIAC